MLVILKRRCKAFLLQFFFFFLSENCLTRKFRAVNRSLISSFLPCVRLFLLRFGGHIALLLIGCDGSCFVCRATSRGVCPSTGCACWALPPSVRPPSSPSASPQTSWTPTTLPLVGIDRDVKKHSGSHNTLRQMEYNLQKKSICRKGQYIS